MPLVPARSQEAGTTSKVTSCMRKEAEKGGAPGQVPQVGRQGCSDFSIPILKMGSTTHVLLCLGDKGEHLEKVLPSSAGSWQDLVFTAAVGADLGWEIFLEDAELEQRMRGGWYRGEAFSWTAQGYLPYSRTWEAKLLSLFLSWKVGNERLLGLRLEPAEGDLLPKPLHHKGHAQVQSQNSGMNLQGTQGNWRCDARWGEGSAQKENPIWELGQVEPDPAPGAGLR